MSVWGIIFLQFMHVRTLAKIMCYVGMGLLHILVVEHFDSFTDIERIYFFQSSLKDLHEAASEGYEALQSSCQKTYDEIQWHYPEVPTLHDPTEL